MAPGCRQQLGLTHKTTPPAEHLPKPRVNSQSLEQHCELHVQNEPFRRHEAAAAGFGMARDATKGARTPQKPLLVEVGSSATLS